MPIGTKASYADTVTQIRSVVADFDVISAREVPLLKLISGGDEFTPSLNSLSQTCIQTKHEWMEDADFALQTTLSAAFADTVGTSCSLAAADVGKVNEGTIILVDSEQMRVTATTGANPITVSRGWGGSTAATHSSGATVYIVGTAHEEGKDAPSAVYTYPTMPFNYVQEFTDTILLSEIEQSVKRYGIAKALEYETNKRTAELYKKMERQCFYGLRVQPASGVPGAFGGLETFIPSGNIIDAASAALTSDMISQGMQKVYDTVGMASAPNTILVGSWGRQKISKIYGTTNVTTFREVASRRGGVKVDVFDTDFGPLDVVLTPWQPKDKVYLLRTDKLGIGPLDGRAMRREMLAKTGSADKWMITGVYTFEVRSSVSHAIIKNISLVS